MSKSVDEIEKDKADAVKLMNIIETLRACDDETRSRLLRSVALFYGVADPSKEPR